MTERKEAVRANAAQFWRLLQISIVVSGATVAIAAISKYSAAYYAEKARQSAFMMKTCVDAGGQWVKNLTPTWNCIRPLSEAPRDAREGKDE